MEEPVLIDVESFTVAGISTRTINADEVHADTARLPALWGRFFGEGIAGKVPARDPDSPIYGVYSKYASDGNGRYTVTAGVAVSVVSNEFESVTVNGGRYLVFEGRGPMPQVVIDTWASVWSYFEESTTFQRAYTTDFEVFGGPEEIAIHIAVDGAGGGGGPRT